MVKQRKKPEKKTKNKSDLVSIILGGMLLGSGLLILLVYAIAYLFNQNIEMPCNLQVTVSALISFGIAFVWKLIGGEK